MRDQEIIGLQEAYLEVYSEIDEAKEDEGLTPLQKIRKRNKDVSLVSSPGEQTRERRMYHKSGRGIKKERGDKYDIESTVGKDKWSREAEVKKRYGVEYGQTGRRERNIRAIKSQKRVGGEKGLPEQVDLYDIILAHLLDEGYAETPEAAEAIMVNMSEEWRESIVEESMPPRRSKEERSKRAKQLGDRQTIRNVVGKYNKEKPLSKQENPDKYYSNN
jgi:hypothetical protein